MAVNFPDSPSTNDTFTSGALTFTWNGSAWKLDPSSGTKGEKGQKGEVGVTGDKGQKGEKGEVGDKGQKGEIGATGGTGGTGAKGQKGEVGATGATGAAAAKGQKGEVGATGSGGSAGDKGSTGDKGDKGAPSTVAGDKGQKGEIGATGSGGSTGSDGDKGQKGEEGPQGGGAPVGQIVAWSGSAGSLPSGYFLCDGSAISRSTYAALYDIVGTTHGSGNGSSTFNIPDLRDRFVVGASNSTGDTTYPGVSPSATGGSADAILKSHTHNLQNHVHGVNLTTDNPGDHNHSYNQPNFTTYAFTGGSGSQRSQGTSGASTGGAGGHTHTVSGNTGASVPNTTDTLGEDATNKNLPPYYALAYIIQYAQGGTTAKGQKGEVGATGSGGAGGDKGQKGEVGDKGAASSVQGPTGDKGQKGEVGATGGTGGTGSTGTKGQKGEIGAGGSSGSDGSDGDKGQKGDPSTTAGDKGQKGEVGSTGSTGDKGAAGGGAPVGQIVSWSGSAGSLPTGYFLCDGSAVSRTTYAALYAIVGTTHGAGNGSSTFNLPDLRDRFVVGASNSTGDTTYPGVSPGATGGSATDTVNISGSDTVNISVSGSTGFEQLQGGGTFVSTGSLNRRHTHTFSGSGSDTVNISGSDTVNTLPPFYALAYIIQYAQGGDAAKGQKGEAGATVSNKPAFRATITGSDVALTNNAHEVIPYNNEEFDTDNCFNTSTHRFTPNVSGYYYVSASVTPQHENADRLAKAILTMYKNSTEIASCDDDPGDQTYHGDRMLTQTASTIVHMNGSSDYLECKVFSSRHSSGSVKLFTSETSHYFQAFKLII